MNWAAYSTLFGLATFKFMFSAFPGPLWKLSFIETYVCIFLGGTLSASVFYFASDYFISLTNERRKKKIEKLLAGDLKPVKTAELGKAQRFDESGDRYIEFCKSTVPPDVSFDSLRIVLDLSLIHI